MYSGNRKYPGNFENKLVSSSFKWVPKYIQFLTKLKGRGRPFWCIDLSCKLSFACGGNVNYYKSVHHRIPIRGNREHPGNFQNKSLSSPFSWVSRYILFLAKLKGGGRFFFEEARRRTTLWDYPREHLVVIRDEKVSSFVKFEIILPLLFFSRPLTNCR